MGCCQSAEQESSSLPVADSSTPLLTNKETGEPYDSLVTRQPQSARQFKTGQTNYGHSTSDPKPIDMRPVKISAVDKRLQDHSQLYNDHLDRYFSLKTTVTELCEMFPEDNPRHTVFGCFQHIQTLCCDARSVVVNRKFQHCMEIEYEGREVHYTVIPAFITFNKANKLVKDIIEKGVPLVKTIELVIKDEKELRREVLVASLGEDGPQCMKNCIEGVADLKKVPPIVEDVRKDTLKIFESLKDAAQLLIRDEDIENMNV